MIKKYKKVLGVCGAVIMSTIIFTSSENKTREASVINVTKEIVTTGEVDYKNITVKGLPDTFKSEYGYYLISFKVTNGTSQSIDTLTINISFLDENGDIIDNSYPQVPDVVQPGQSINIEGIVEANSEIKYTSVTGVTYSGADEEYYEVKFFDEVEKTPMGEITPSKDITTDDSAESNLSISNVQKTYEEALSITRKDITSNGTAYYYGDINILAEEVEWIDQASYADENTNINQGAIYRSLAKKLRGFYIGEGKYYGNWKSITPTIFGYEALDTWEEMLPYVEEAGIYITEYNSLPEIMNKLQGLECVDGTFDYVTRNFDFVINDLSQAISDLNISEEMLGYILASLDEYGPNASFSGNTFTFNLSFNDSVEGLSVLDYDDFNFIENGVKNNPIESFCNDYQGGEITLNYSGYLPEYDKYRHNIIQTHRNIQLGSSFNAVLYAYGNGKEGNTLGYEDYLYSYFNEIESEYLEGYVSTSKSYMTYTYPERQCQITFIFDENDKVSWIISSYNPNGESCF